MKLSKRSKYGLLALADLASRDQQGPIPLKELAQQNNIPQKFLEQIFLSLRNAGIVQSQIGVGGGYLLGRESSDITIGEIIRVLDGTIAPVSCVSKMAYGRCTCPDETRCPVRQVMGNVRNAIVAVIDSITLADIATTIPDTRSSNELPQNEPQSRESPPA